MSEPSPADWIRPLLGRADDMRAEVWLRCTPGTVADATGSTPVVASGTLVGPECSTAATLPTTVALVDQGSVAGQSALAKGVCTEPGFWTPELPNLYRADVTLRRGDDVVAAGRRMIGLRRLGVKGRSFSLDGRRYVPRGVPGQADRAGLEVLRQLAAVAVVGFPAATGPTADASAATLEAMLTRADQIGMAVIIRLAPSQGGAVDPGLLRERLEAWSAHPAAFLVIIPFGLADLAVAVGRRRGTMLLGIEVDGLAPPPPQKAKGTTKAKAAATKVPEAKKKKAAADGQSPTKRGADEAGAEMTPRTKRNRREVGGGAPLEKLMMLRARLGVSTGALSSLPRL